jgi:hypothetical protein
MAASNISSPESKIKTSTFYSESKGHLVTDLAKFRAITLAERPHKPIIYLAGDSSLDNKHWFNKPSKTPVSMSLPSTPALSNRHSRNWMSLCG